MAQSQGCEQWPIIYLYSHIFIITLQFDKFKIKFALKYIFENLESIKIRRKIYFSVALCIYGLQLIASLTRPSPGVFLM